MKKYTMSKFLLGTSLLAVLSTGTLATNVQEIAREEFAANKIAKKLYGTNDYLLNLDVGKESKKIGEAVKNKHQNRLPLTRLQQDAQTEINRLLTLAKTASLESRTLPNGSIITTNFKHGDLVVAFQNHSLVYPCLSTDDREKHDAFLPTTYKSHFLSKALYDEVRYYSNHLGLSEKNANRLYRYLEPLFYIVQMELSPLLDGGQTKSLYQSPRWVYSKSYEDMVKSVKRQADHHLYMFNLTPITGLNKPQVIDRLAPDLLDLGLALLPHPERNLHKDGNKVYTLGTNRAGHLSLIHPYADNLPYPVLNEHRQLLGMNIPAGMGDSVALSKQWNRVNQFIRLNDYHFSEGERNTMSHVLQALGTLFHKHLSTFHVQRFPVGDNYRALTEEMAISFINNYTIPEPYLTAFYHRDIDPDIYQVLAGIKSKGNTHRYLTSDLWPRRLADEDRQVALINEGFKFLMFKDILDRSELFNEYGDVIRMADMMAL